jgi:hypothetical protein
VCVSLFVSSYFLLKVVIFLFFYFFNHKNWVG